MSVITDVVDPKGRYKEGSAKPRTVSAKEMAAKDSRITKSQYTPTGDEMTVLTGVKKDFQKSWQTMHLPRPEFNDMSLYQRHMLDMLAFNTYQVNDGNPAEQDRLGGWKSTAMRPYQRNKAISIAAHETARLTVPKIFAFNEQNDEEADSAKVMSYAMDWAREEANYSHQELFRIIASLYSPISWGYTEYAENYRMVRKDQNPDGSWNFEEVLDEDTSGFIHLPIPTDQVFFPNFFERDPQKQDHLIVRRIISYEAARAKYENKYPNFKFVQPGIITIMDDANTGFYNVYDPHMRGDDVEEVIRWKKLGNSFEIDSRHIMVNGILLTPAHSANPRQDHQYPLDCFYYLPINERCIAGKSLVFAMGPEAALLNQQYQMINDKSYLDLFPPTISTGSDKVGSDVYVPGLNLAFSEPDVKVTPIMQTNSTAIQMALKVSEQVEASLNQSSQDPVQQGQNPGTPSTAYEISRIEQNAATVLGLSMKFIAQHAIDVGNLFLSDILQYMTIAEVRDIAGDDGLIYKTFYAKEPGQAGKTNKVKFDINLPDSMNEDEKLAMSFKLLEEQGGFKSDVKLWKVNPILWRTRKYKFTVDEDVLNPRSADLERAMDLETYDRAIANPVADQEKIFKDLLMGTNPKTARDPDAYVMKQQPTPPPIPGQQPDQGTTGNTIAPAPNNKPIPSSMGKLPQAIG